MCFKILFTYGFGQRYNMSSVGLLLRVCLFGRCFILVSEQLKEEITHMIRVTMEENMVACVYNSVFLHLVFYPFVWSVLITGWIRSHFCYLRALLQKNKTVKGCYCGFGRSPNTFLAPYFWYQLVHYITCRTVWSGNVKKRAERKKREEGRGRKRER